MQFVNIGCGDTYVPGWRNLDYVPHSRLVQRANLLERLPLDDAEADVVYSSHFSSIFPAPESTTFAPSAFV